VSWKGGYKELFISGQSRETQNKRPDFSSANPKEKKEKNFIHTTASRRRRRRVDKRGGEGTHAGDTQGVIQSKKEKIPKKKNSLSSSSYSRHANNNLKGLSC
jgi:hypothetical protein